jgi:hypothetical protein
VRRRNNVAKAHMRCRLIGSINFQRRVIVAVRPVGCQANVSGVNVRLNLLGGVLIVGPPRSCSAGFPEDNWPFGCMPGEFSRRPGRLDRARRAYIGPAPAFSRLREAVEPFDPKPFDLLAL